MDVVQQIRAFNAGRNPERLGLKYNKMRSDPFAYLRGACHMFYERLPCKGLFKSAPWSGHAVTCMWRTSAATRVITGRSIST